MSYVQNGQEENHYGKGTVKDINTEKFLALKNTCLFHPCREPPKSSKYKHSMAHSRHNTENHR